MTFKQLKYQICFESRYPISPCEHWTLLFGDFDRFEKMFYADKADTKIADAGQLFKTMPRCLFTNYIVCTC